MKRLMFAAVLAFGLSAGAAFADQPTGQAVTNAEPVAVPVAYSDLDLSSTQDATALLSRLRNAAMRACEVNAAQRPNASLRRAIAECQSAAMDEAVASAHSPEVSRLYAEQKH